MDPQPESRRPSDGQPTQPLGGWSAPGLSCRELVAFRDDYVAEELAPGRRALFELHLARCGDCRRYLQSYRATVELCRAAYAD